MPGAWGGQRKGRSCPRRIARFVEPVLLLLLHRRPMHGYALMEGLLSLGLEDYPVDSSAIYRTLRSLEKSGMVQSRWDIDVAAGPPRRVYTITERGEAYLAHWVEDIRATDRVLQTFLAAYQAGLEIGNPSAKVGENE